MFPREFISISIVIPVYSGDQYLAELISQIDKVRRDWELRDAPMQLAEAVLIDDSAVDNSPALIDKLAAEFPWVAALHLMRNFGQHAATVAGILHTSGDWVVTLDEDLQHSPVEIETMLRKISASCADIVYAKPKGAVHEAKSRDFASRWYKCTMVLLTGNRNISKFNSFRLIRGSLARAASSVCGHDTFFDVALSWFTNRIQFVELDLKDRRFIERGKSGYNLARLLSHARRMLMSSQVKIVRLCSLFGVLISGVSLLGGFLLFAQKLVYPETVLVGGWTSLMLINLFFGGFITFMVGIALEYLSALVLVAHGKPIFFVVDRTLDEKLLEYFSAFSP